MDQYQPFGRVRINLKFSQASQKIFRILGLPMEKRADDKLLFVRLVPAVLAKLLFTDQKAGDTLCQKGILAYLFRGTGDANHRKRRFQRTPAFDIVLGQRAQGKHRIFHHDLRHSGTVDLMVDYCGNSALSATFDT